MVHVTVELWMWMGEELGENFQSLSHMRSMLHTQVMEGTTVRELFSRLAEQYSPIEDKVFRSCEMRFHPYVVTTLNHKVVSAGELYDRALKEGDTITVLPMYMGG